MPKGQKPYSAGEKHLIYSCPCMKEVVKYFTTEAHRSLYKRLHDKTCKMLDVQTDYLCIDQFKETGKIIKVIEL